MHRYKVLKVLGEGAQGVVSKAKLLKPPPDYDETQDGKPPKYVAMKRMKPQDYKTGITIATIREIMILRELHHPNIINIVDIFIHGEHIYMIMPYMLGDLEQLIRDKSIILEVSHIKAFMQMLLDAMHYCHTRYILHRDLKPSNCLIGNDRKLRISDFGLAREYGSPTRNLSWQACTRWYRAPELLFGSTHYGPGLDIWSIGCIFGELMLRVPLFPGMNEIDQLGRIFMLFGVPKDIQKNITTDGTTTINTNENENENKNALENNSEGGGNGYMIWKDYSLLPKFRRFADQKPMNLKEVFKAATDSAIDLFQQMCVFQPNDRISCDQALKHQYFKEMPLPTPVEELPLPNKQNKENSLAVKENGKGDDDNDDNE